MDTETKLAAIIDAATGLTELEWRALAIAALDQGGVHRKTLRRVAELVNVCIDCQIEEILVNDRCETCAELYDDDRLELARDMEIDRRIDEARGR